MMIAVLSRAHQLDQVNVAVTFDLCLDLAIDAKQTNELFNFQLSLRQSLIEYCLISLLQ